MPTYPGHRVRSWREDETIEDILRQAGQHTTEAHGLAVTPELVEAVKARTTEG